MFHLIAFGKNWFYKIVIEKNRIEEPVSEVKISILVPV